MKEPIVFGLRNAKRSTVPLRLYEGSSYLGLLGAAVKLGAKGFLA